MTKPLEITSLSHRFGDTETFENVSLSVEPGELVALLGASGSGKSTLLRAVAGFSHPHSGQIHIGGKLAHNENQLLIKPEDRRVGMVFQDYALFPHMSVSDNIAFGIHQDKDRDERTTQLLKLLDITELAERLPSELSGGQQQRVALARALAPRPALLLLDEPFANLDASLRASVGQDVQALLKTEEVSALMVTHDRGEALGLSTKVAVLGPESTSGNNRLLQVDSPSALYDTPASAVVANLTGRVTTLKGTATGTKADTALGELELAQELQGPCTIFLRPEAIGFQACSDGALRVSHRAYRGGSYEILAESPAGPLLLQSDAAHTPAVGERGKLSLRVPPWAISS